MQHLAPSAILFDFYGTLVEEDDVPIGRMCGQIAAASPMAITAQEVGSYWGQVYRQLCSESYGSAFRLQRELEQLSLEHVLQRFQADLDGDALSQVLYAYWTHPKIYPESREVLSRCRVPVCLVSNIDNADLESALKHNRLRFDQVVTSEDCRAYKPRKEMFERALSLLGLLPGEVLHVGDSLSSDVRGAQSMGIPVLWINRRGRQLPDTAQAPDYVGTELRVLLSILEA